MQVKVACIDPPEALLYAVQQLTVGIVKQENGSAERLGHFGLLPCQGICQG